VLLENIENLSFRFPLLCRYMNTSTLQHFELHFVYISTSARPQLENLQWWGKI